MKNVAFPSADSNIFGKGFRYAVEVLFGVGKAERG